MKYDLLDIQRGFRDPGLIIRELNSHFHRFRGDSPYNDRGTGIFERDWDNLILLDACRFDVFEGVADFPGRLSSRTTLGSRTAEFIRANFTGEQHYDLVYVSENGWYQKLREEINSSVFKFVLHSEDHFPTRHQNTTETALEMAEKYPNKRLLIHYLPPHHPYYGPLAEKHLPAADSQADLFNKIRNGSVDISDETLRAIYTENLERVLPLVTELLDTFTGKTVVSADHGEYLGERSSPIPIKMYGHPTSYVKELTKVPWYVHDWDSRKRINPEKSVTDTQDRSDRNVDDHLRDLGYKP